MALNSRRPGGARNHGKVAASPHQPPLRHKHRLNRCIVTGTSTKTQNCICGTSIAQAVSPSLFLMICGTMPRSVSPSRFPHDLLHDATICSTSRKLYHLRKTRKTHATAIIDDGRDHFLMAVYAGEAARIDLKIQSVPIHVLFCQARDFCGLHVEISYQQARLPPGNNTKLSKGSIKQLLS